MRQFDYKELPLPDDFAQKLMETAYLAQKLPEELKNSSIEEMSYGLYRKKQLEFVKYAGRHKGVLRALLGVHLVIAVLFMLKAEFCHYHWVSLLLFRHLMIGQRYLIEALIGLPKEGRRAILEAISTHDDFYEQWRKTYVGAVNVARIVYSLLNSGREVYYPFPRTDGKYKVDLIIPQKRGPWVCIQVKGGSRLQSCTFDSKPKVNGYYQSEVEVMNSLWKGVRALNHRYGAGWAAAVLWIPTIRPDMTRLRLEEDIVHEVKKIMKEAKNLADARNVPKDTSA